MRTRESIEGSTASDLRDAVSLIKDGSARSALPVGSEIDYMGERAVVVADDGGPSLLVEADGIGQEWMWEFEGKLCTVVSIGAEGSLVALGRWAPIKSAPRDGSRVLIYREGFAEDRAVCWWSESSEEWEAVNGSTFPGATHWMTAPAAPGE